MKTEERSANAVGRGGFTLVEVLLVVVILGILAGVVVGTFAKKQKGAMIRATRASIAAICTQVDLYEVDTGRFPPSLQSLIQNDGAPNWDGPYLKGGMPADSWGTAFQYQVRGEKDYTVSSAGPDLQHGTGDDITSFASPTASE